MIIIDELPFRYVDRQGFKEFMEVVEPRIPIPHYCCKGLYEDLF